MKFDDILIENRSREEQFSFDLFSLKMLQISLDISIGQLISVDGCFFAPTVLCILQQCVNKTSGALSYRARPGGNEEH